MKNKKESKVVEHPYEKEYRRRAHLRGAREACVKDRSGNEYRCVYYKARVIASRVGYKSRGKFMANIVLYGKPINHE